MLRRLCISILIVGATVSGALALDTRPYAGTWVGKLSNGDSVKLVIPRRLGEDDFVQYWYDGELQSPQVPKFLKNRIRLDNPGPNYLIIGPVEGQRMRYYWTDGDNSARTILKKRTK